MSDHSSVNFTIINNSQMQRGTPISFNSSSMSSLTYHKDNQLKTYFFAPDGKLIKDDTLISTSINNAMAVGSSYYGYYSGTLAFAHTHNIAHTHGTDSQGAHTHSVTAAGSNSDSGGTECRPDNLTVRIWKRTA